MSWQKSKNLVLARTKLRMHLKYVTGQPLKYSPEQKESTQGGGWPTTPLRFVPYAKGPKDPLSDFPFLSL